jgi:hypothetical protein
MESTALVAKAKLLLIAALVTVALTYLPWLADTQIRIGSYFLAVVSVTVAVLLFVLFTRMSLSFHRKHDALA